MLGKLQLVFICSVLCMFGINVMIGGLGLFAFRWGGVSLVYGWNTGVCSGFLVYVIYWAIFKDWESVD
jgi:hypothetical protein